MNEYGDSIVIEVVRGGFILSYPAVGEDQMTSNRREVFSSPRKLNQKIKEVIDSLSLVADK